MVATAPDVIALTPLVAAPRTAGRERGVDLRALQARYGGRLAIPMRTDRPTIVANFVSTLDGVVSYNTAEGAGGGEISGFFEPDRFVMGLLRGLADAVLIGAGTLRAGGDERWTPSSIHPPSAPHLGELRAALGMRPDPFTAVVTATGSVDLAHPGLADPGVDALIVTTDTGGRALNAAGVPAHIDVRTTGAAVHPRDIVDALAAHGAELVLCEGGPRLLGQLLEARLIDELFLTIAPQVAGRSAEVPRLGLVEETSFDVAGAPWARLVDLRRAGHHLFTRYRLNGELR